MPDYFISSPTVSLATIHIGFFLAICGVDPAGLYQIRFVQGASHIEKRGKAIKKMKWNTIATIEELVCARCSYLLLSLKMRRLAMEPGCAVRTVWS